MGHMQLIWQVECYGDPCFFVQCLCQQPLFFQHRITEPEVVLLIKLTLWVREHSHYQGPVSSLVSVASDSRDQFYFRLLSYGIRLMGGVSQLITNR